MNARFLLIQLLLLVVVSLNGCAVFGKENRRVLNSLDDHISPQSPAVQIALAPVAVPAASGALLVDAAIVNPVHAVKPAAQDTYELYWKPRDVEPLTRAMLFVPVVVLTPPTFVAAWLVHSFIIG
jgi:hypothetical protein